MHDASGKELSTPARRFAGEHEAFHLAGQIFGCPTPNMLIFGPRPESTPITDRFFNELAEALTNRKGKTILQIAAESANRYQAMSPGDKYIVDFFSAVEWPAEYYAFRSMTNKAANWNINEYYKVRQQLGDEAAYRVAVPVGIALDEYLGPSKWTGLIFKGSSMFAMFAQSGFPEINIPVDMIKITGYPLNIQEISAPVAPMR